MSDAGIILLPAGNTAYVGASVKVSQSFANNVGATSIVGTNPRKPARKYRCEVSIVLTALATLAANAAFNVIATDAVGAFTWPIPLNTPAALPALTVNFGAGGTQRASGIIVVESNGLATDLSISLTGITTPGALAGIWTFVLTPIG